MSKFNDNVNEYIRQRKFSDRYISIMTGWSEDTVRSVLHEKSLSEEKMKILAEALGEDVEFFKIGTKEDMKLPPSLNSLLTLSEKKLSRHDALITAYVIEMLRYHDALTSF